MAGPADGAAARASKSVAPSEEMATFDPKIRRCGKHIGPTPSQQYNGTMGIRRVVALKDLIIPSEQPSHGSVTLIKPPSPPKQQEGSRQGWSRPGSRPSSRQSSQ